MSRQLTSSIVADGGTDLMLVPVIQWAIHRLDPDVEILEPEFRKRRGGIEEFLRTYNSGAMVVFVHHPRPTVRGGAPRQRGRLRAPGRGYVVVHELVHLRPRGHRDYWQALGRVMPDYERRREDLRQRGVGLAW